MGNLAKLKVAVGQPELIQGAPSRNEAVKDRMIAHAVEAGADILVLPGSLIDESEVHIIALNDSRIDIAGSVVMLEAAGESYQIGLGACPQGCDFGVFLDVQPWVDERATRTSWPGIVLRPVGMCNVGKKVLAYDGGTTVFARDGMLVSRLRDDFEEDFAVVNMSEPGDVVTPCKDKLLAALVKTLRRFDEQVLNWSPKWIIGLSGGLDSSIVASLLTLAIGPERVIGYNMASAYNSETTRKNASQLADALGISLREGSIEDLVEATKSSVGSFGFESEDISGAVLENVQARIRGHLLSTFAALEKGVVVNNGNRVESAFGYATLYGDAIGALSPIGDLTKTKLFDLARVINGEPGCEIVPENLLPRITPDGFEWEMMPSAELSEGQFDPMKWFYHDWLLEQLLDGQGVDAGACSVFGRYLDDRLEGTEVGRWVSYYGLDDPKAFLEDFDWVMSSMRASTFKRIQAPPVITVASHASVNAPELVQGEIEMSQRFKELRARILRLSR